MSCLHNARKPRHDIGQDNMIVVVVQRGTLQEKHGDNLLLLGKRQLARPFNQLMKRSPDSIDITLPFYQRTPSAKSLCLANIMFLRHNNKSSYQIIFRKRPTINILARIRGNPRMLSPKTMHASAHKQAWFHPKASLVFKKARHGFSFGTVSCGLQHAIVFQKESNSSLAIPP